MFKFVFAGFAALFWTNDANSAEYHVCKENSLQSGDLIALSNISGEKCWKKYSTKEIDISKLVISNELGQFGYVFEDNAKEIDYDPILSVKELTPISANINATTEINLIRKAMKTICSKEFEYPKIDGIKISAISYQLYHVKLNRAPDRNLVSFHIQYKPKFNSCIATTNKSVRKSFSVEDLISSPSNKFTELASAIFGSGIAVAGNKTYSDIEVEIVKGRIESGFVIGRWKGKVEPGVTYLVQDLSNSEDGFKINTRLKRVLK